MKNDTFTLKYNVTGSERQRLVRAISEITGVESKYQGAPSFAYEVDYFTIDRNGNVTFDARADSEEIETLIEELYQHGFEAEPAQPGSESETGFYSLNVQMPGEYVDTKNLTRLLQAKGALIKKALGIEDVSFAERDGRVSFDWFKRELTADETKAYTHFISALCEMSRQHRVTATEKPVENEKYAFRCFLLRLGFIGAEYKQERKILLRNLTGSSAFKSGQKKEAEPASDQIPPLDWDAENRDDAVFIAEFNATQLAEAVSEGGAD